MQLGISDFYYDTDSVIPVDVRYRRFQEAGFSCIDFNTARTDTPFYTTAPRELEKLMGGIRTQIEDLGLRVHQVHGPWCWPPVKDTTPEGRVVRTGVCKGTGYPFRHRKRNRLPDRAVNPTLPIRRNQFIIEISAVPLFCWYVILKGKVTNTPGGVSLRKGWRSWNYRKESQIAFRSLITAKTARILSPSAPKTERRYYKDLCRDTPPGVSAEGSTIIAARTNCG